MSSIAQTKVFGLSLSIDPKIVLGALLVFAAFVFWYESHDESQPNTGASSNVARSAVAPVSGQSKSRRLTIRRSSIPDQNKLELRVIDIRRGDIDPTLRLDLLTRLHELPEPATRRNVFEFVQSPDPAMKEEIKGPIIVPAPPAVVALPPPASVTLPFSIALKYCGFVKSQDLGKNRKGFFLDGDNVLIGSEGDILNHRYRIVGLTTASAELEDVELKQGQTLSLIAKVNP